MSKLYKFTCIVCPLGCYVEAKFEGNNIIIKGCKCPRGEKWVKEEILAPKRTIISVVKVKNGKYPVVSIKSDKPVPKDKIGKIMRLLSKFEINAPVRCGDILISNILDLGVNIIATREVESKK